jgi:hypothetical protein
MEAANAAIISDLEYDIDWIVGKNAKRDIGPGGAVMEAANAVIISDLEYDIDWIVGKNAKRDDTVVTQAANAVTVGDLNSVIAGIDGH